MNPQVSIVINCDTRSNWLDDSTEIRNYGDASLLGCRSVDFMLSGVRNKRKFFEGCDLETILVIDKREEIPNWVMVELDAMLTSGEISKLVIETFNHSRPRWNDWIYYESCKHATKEYLVHFDGDAAAFRRPEFPLIEKCIEWLDSGHNFVCQQTPLPEAEHGMWWASTRFFMCKRETLKLEEIRRCFDDGYRWGVYGSKRWSPCFEHLASLVAGEKVLYPPCDNDNFVLVNWVTYRKGLLEWLNNLPYDEVRRYVFETCGGPLGASDLICQDFICT